ncbi:hypothetical protein DFJ74DRAFT_693902 [Hyaloraphidium curvatum]|nr:hypothetical protein DFJ74DRAFT_693902 [Hyaloraphidium curvatum]
MASSSSSAPDEDDSSSFSLFSASPTSDASSLHAARLRDARTSALAAADRDALLAPDLSGSRTDLRGVEARRRRYKLSGPHRKLLRIPNVWTAEECQRVARACERAGFGGERHDAFPTYDVAVAKLADEERDFVARTLRERVLVPATERLGFHHSDFEYRDLFVVRYDARDGQQGLGEHTDGCLVSFNVLLNPPEEFEGGGTFFPELDQTADTDPQESDSDSRTLSTQKVDCKDESPPSPDGYLASNALGSALVHDAKLLHAGRPITSGVRLICVGFVDTRRGPYRGDLWVPDQAGTGMRGAG